jgi:zinc protease
VPDNVFYLDVNASVDVKNTAIVHQYLNDIVEELKTKKVSKKELKTLTQIFIVNKRNYLQNDATAGWKTYLVGQIKNGESLEDLENYEKILWSITPEDIQKAFNKLINLDNQVILSIGEFTPCEN